MDGSSERSDVQAERALAEQALAALEDVIDPEVGIDVVNLGLVYEVRADGDYVHVRMTMTTPACPLGPYLCEEAEAAIRSAVPGVGAVAVEMVLDPPWSPQLMSAKARKWLGR